MTGTWGRAGRHKKAAVLCTGLFAFALAAAISGLRVPEPRVHDEFSYLLAADTYASGRMTNPTHPMWTHFETFHVIHAPSYMSSYPPAQGLALAVGQLIGDPIVGAWLATGLAVAACCWMFQAWMPGRWAMVGAIVIALHHGVQFYWGQSYWGGAVAMGGGALLFGAWARLRRRPRRSDAVWLAVGVAVLANSRPFEGLVACVPVAVSLLRVAWRAGSPPLRIWLRDVVAPALVVLAVAAAAMLVHNAAITGDPLRLPYQVHEQTYSDTPLFTFLESRPEPEWRHAAIRDFYQGWVRSGFTNRQSVAFAIVDSSRVIPFYLTPFLAIAMVAFPWIFRSPRQRFALLVLSLSFAATWVIPWEARSHYLSSVAALWFVVPVQGLRQIDQWRSRGRAFGRRAVMLLLAGHTIVFIAGSVRYRELERPAWAIERARIQQRLQSEAGQHLVLVEYRASHDPHEEWVWNAADIDAAKVVWARTGSAPATREIRKHFSAHRVWLLQADPRPARLQELQPGREDIRPQGEERPLGVNEERPVG